MGVIGKVIGSCIDADNKARDYDYRRQIARMDIEVIEEKKRIIENEIDDLTEKVLEKRKEVIKYMLKNDIDFSDKNIKSVFDELKEINNDTISKEKEMQKYLPKGITNVLNKKKENNDFFSNLFG